MEEVQGLCLTRTALKREERSAYGGGARSAISPASRMENYAEIFGGFAASCSIPVLMLPEAMDGYEKEQAGSQSSGLNYLEIFGVLNAGTFSLSYEEVFPMEKGTKVEDEGDRFLDETDIHQAEKGPHELPAEALFRGHITFSKLNQLSSSSHSSQKSMGDEVKKTICVSSLQTYFGSEFEAETGSPTGFVEDESYKNVASDDHILSRCPTEAEEEKQREILISSSVSAALDAFENHLNDVHKPLSKDAAYDLKQHSRSSSYHSTSSGDIPVTDYAFLTISDINLRTQPVEVPPPSRAPPKMDVKQGMSKSEALEASNISFNRNFLAHNVRGRRTRHALKETAKSTPVYSNVEVDASKAAAMVEAMEQAQASLKRSKELMERNKNEFGIWNGQNIISSGESINEAKMAEKVVNNQLEREIAVLFEHDEEEGTQEKESRTDKLSGLTNDEKYNGNKGVKLVRRLDSYEYFPDKVSVGLQGQMSFHGGDGNHDENKAKMFKSYRINEKKIISGVEFQMQDGNAKKLKPGVIIDEEDAMINFETSPLSYLQGDDEDEQIIGRALPVVNDDTISLIGHDGNENEVKQCQESCICAVEKNNGDGDKEPNACLDRKLEEFNGGEALEETKLSSLQNASEVEVDTEYRASFSRIASFNDGKDSEVESIDNSSKQENRSFCGIDKSNEPLKKQRAKWNIPSRSEFNVAKFFIQPDCLEKPTEARRAHSSDDVGNILSPFVDDSGSSWKQMEKSIPDERRDANNITKELLEAEEKRKLEEKERAREREKDLIATHEDCVSVFIEARERPEKIVSERVLAEVWRRPIAAYRDITEKSSSEAFKNWKHNETESIVRPGYKESDNNLKFTYDVNDAPIDMKSQSEGCEGESPLRCKARQERCQRIVERAAKALAEKNMRDLLAQREQEERNRLAESLDAEVRRWSSAKEGNLRALLSTLQYILGHDSGWQPIPLTEIITATAVRKVYRKATLYVHPDKLQQRGATIQHKYICEKVFDLLKDAWNKFNSEG